MVFLCEAIEKVSLKTTTCLLNDMLLTLLASHIVQQRPPSGFMMPKFTMYDGIIDPFDHLIHYCQVMTLDIEDDALLCKVFLASL